MAQYGYMYKSVSTYNTVREDSRRPVTKPFVPFVPNSNSNPDGYVTKKKIVPVASRPYDDDDDYDDYKKHSSPSDEWQRPKSPVRGTPRKVDGFLTKLQNEASRRQRSSPVPTTDWRPSSQPTSYTSPNGYGGDYGGNKEGRKPIGSAIRNGGYNGPSGYGDYNNKEGYKRSSSPIRNGKYDDYDGGNNGYGGYGNYDNKEGYKPSSGPNRSDKYGGYDGVNNGYGNYDNKEGRMPFGSTTRNDKYDGYNGGNGYGDYGNYNKEGHKPTGSPVRIDKYDAYDDGNNGYGNYNNKEGQRPFGSSPKSSKYYGYNGGNGYGDNGSYNNKEGHKPTSSPIRNDNYDSLRPSYGAMEPNRNIHGGLTKPKVSTAWTASPRKGTQLSEPTTNIDKAMELLKEAARVSANDHSSKGGHKATATALPYDNYDNYQRGHDGVDKSTPSNNWAASRGNEPRSKFDDGMNLVKEAEKLKNIATGHPQPRFAAPKPATPTEDGYGETTDRRNAPSWYANLNISSRPRTAPKHVTFIGREADYGESNDHWDDKRRDGVAPIMDSRFAEKQYGGKRI